MNPLKTIVSKDFDTQKLQSNILEFSKNITKNPLMQARLIKGVALTSGTDNPVYHNLGRDIVGYIIVSKSSDSNVWDSQIENSNASKSLILNCDANTTVSLIVF